MTDTWPPDRTTPCAFDGCERPGFCDGRHCAAAGGAIRLTLEEESAELTDAVIAYRVNGGEVEFVAAADGNVAMFTNRDAAVAYAATNRLFQSGQAKYQIVVLDELCN
jgi:hypothetical protein